MPNVNLVVLIGTLTRDPEVKYTAGEKSIANIGLAINHAYTTDAGEKRETVTFVDVEMWGKLADLCSQYVKKGDPLYVSGRLHLDSWDDKTTGQKRTKMKVIADQMQFLASKGKREDSAPPPPRGHAAAPRKPVDPDLDGMDAEDDIPFKSIVRGLFAAMLFLFALRAVANTNTEERAWMRDHHSHCLRTLEQRNTLLMAQNAILQAKP